MPDNRSPLRNIAPFSLLLPPVLTALLLAPETIEPAPTKEPVPCQQQIKTIPALPVATAPDFSAFPAGKPRKDAFVSYFLPIINHENSRILADRKNLQCFNRQYLKNPASLTNAEQSWIKSQAKKYRLVEFDPGQAAQWGELLARVNTIPASLALAQGANESAWGTSRFAREGNNFFGQWCFRAGCGIVPKSRPEGASYEVAIFKSPQQSVQRYMLNLNSHPKYSPLRTRRFSLQDNRQPAQGGMLAEGLLEYSARGEDYISDLKKLMQFNNWARYDQGPGET